MADPDCIFCKIAKGQSPTHIVWEDEKHIAFLSIFPNTEGFTVVATKKHHPSYAFDLPDKVITDLLLASKKVAKKIDLAFNDVGRTGLILEGFGVDHLHAKLIPMHGTSKFKWQKLASKKKKFFKRYEGYLSSHDSLKENDAKLARIASIIMKAK